MVVLEQDRQGTYRLERRPRRPVALAGVLFLVLAVLPLANEGSVTALRAVTAVSLGLGAALCFFLGLPRDRRLPLPARGSVQRLVLSGSSNIEGYTAEGVGAAGKREVLLTSHDPARVLRDAFTLSTELGVPVEPGWGLDREALALLRAPASAPFLDRPFALCHRTLPDQAIGAGTALWAAAFIPAATFVLALSPARPNVTPTVLALVLPGLTALFALAVGLWLLGLKENLSLEDGRLTRERRWFARPLGPAVETPDVVGLYAVAPFGGPSCHLLLATRSGPVALPTDPKAGQAVAQYPRANERAPGRAAE